MHSEAGFLPELSRWWAHPDAGGAPWPLLPADSRPRPAPYFNQTPGQLQPTWQRGRPFLPASFTLGHVPEERHPAPTHPTSCAGGNQRDKAGAVAIRQPYLRVIGFQEDVLNGDTARRPTFT